MIVKNIKLNQQYKKFNLTHFSMELQNIRRGRSLPSKAVQKVGKKCHFYHLLGHCSLGSWCRFIHEPIKKKYIPKPSLPPPEEKVEVQQAPKLIPQEVQSAHLAKKLKYHLEIRKKDLAQRFSKLRQELLNHFPTERPLTLPLEPVLETFKTGEIGRCTGGEESKNKDGISKVLVV